MKVDKAFFFAKKKQKTFTTDAVAAVRFAADAPDRFRQPATARTKVFWFFFSKKNCLLACFP